MPKKKIKARDLKKQRWAAIIAAVLALGMLVSLVGAYIGQAIGSGGGDQAGIQQQSELQPEDYLGFYQAEVERLEQYLDDHEPTVPVLLELAENYRYLVFIQQVFFDDQDALEASRANLGAVFTELSSLEPENSAHRFELFNLYLETGPEEARDEQLLLLKNMLRQNPDPLVHLSLINVLKANDFAAEVTEEEIEWLFGYLEQSESSENAASINRFYLAVLVGEHRGDVVTAIAMLEAILEDEEEESQVYRDALGYLDYLLSLEETD